MALRIKTMLLLLVPLMSFVLLAVAMSTNTTLMLDTRLLQNIHTHASPTLDSFFSMVTTLGDPVVITIIGAILVGILMYKKYADLAGLVALAIAGSTALSSLLKTSFSRQRPDLWTQIANELSYSFPSGHATASSMLVIVLVYLCWHTKWRMVVIALGIPYILVIAVSRLYLGVHFPSDVIGGWLLSVSWFCILLGIYRLRKASN